MFNRLQPQITTVKMPIVGRTHPGLWHALFKAKQGMVSKLSTNTKQWVGTSNNNMHVTLNLCGRHAFSVKRAFVSIMPITILRASQLLGSTPQSSPA